MQLKSPIPSAKDHLKPTRAFTLLEMLVTVFIIAVLVALLFPVVGSLIAKGAGVTCAAHMRQIGAALWAYKGEHNGWFYPGYPMRATQILAVDQQPGMPVQPGMSGANFMQNLVPEYMPELPICPSAAVDARFRAANPNRRKYFQKQGGTYAVNALLIQTKMDAMPPQYWPAGTLYTYSPGRMPLLMESGWGGITWAMSHADQALWGVWFGATGTGTRVTVGRNHGKGDMLNFMFLDQHMELISKNDKRNIPETSKTWVWNTNPTGRFHTWGQGGRFISASTMSDANFNIAYPQFLPPP